MSFSTFLCFFFFNVTAPTEIYTLSLHDALPISLLSAVTLASATGWSLGSLMRPRMVPLIDSDCAHVAGMQVRKRDRKSTRLNSSHVEISYAVFCLKKKKNST